MTLVNVCADGRRVQHRTGTVGVVVKSPSNLEHSYRVRFPDGVEESLKQNELVMLAKFAEGDGAELIGARLGRPKPTVGCPWSKSAKTRRLNVIRNLVDTLPDDEVAVYEDEIDIHLNPKIGPDWMNREQQKEVMTPGKNQKQYLAGAINAKTRQLTWVESDSKNTYLFLIMLWKLTQEYRDAKVVHVILNNYCVHSTKQVEISLATEERQRLQLVFLPPYCPDHNRIERLWRDLHADVTRNHCCQDIKSLMRRVRN